MWCYSGWSASAAGSASVLDEDVARLSPFVCEHLMWSETSSTLLDLEDCRVLWCYPGMTPQEIAEVRPRLLDFAAEMLGGLPRKDQRAAGELYVRGLLTGGQRKSMQPMAARLGVDHQRLQQFITSRC